MAAMVSSLLVPALLLVAAAGAASVPQEVLCQDGECQGGALHLIQASVQSVSLSRAESDNSYADLDAKGTSPLPADRPETYLLAVNASIIDYVSQQVEYELDSSVREIPVKNKIVLALLELLGLGLCGIDRCFMGQRWLGLLKGLTLGGLTVWALLDYVAVLITCLSMNPQLNAMGMRAHFSDGSVTPSFILVLLVVLFMCCGAPMFVRHKRQPAQMTPIGSTSKSLFEAPPK